MTFPARARCVAAVAAGGILLAAGRAGAVPHDKEAGQAMAFVRVIADVRIDFGGVREPIERRSVELATGSGFVAAPSGLVLTSEHVVGEKEAEELVRAPEGARVRIENRRIEVVVGDDTSRRAFDAWVAASDPELDLAALQVTAADLAYLPLGDSDAAEAGRPVQVLGFPFGRQVEVARGGDAMPGATITAGSLSAAREGEQGDRRYLQTDASVNPGSSGGPMLDEDGYVVGIVRMKLSPGATAAGAGFAVTVNVAKDFLEAHGLLGQLPVGRLRPGVVQTHDWKGVRLEAPDGYTDTAATRVRLDLGEIEGIDSRVYRLPTSLSPEDLADALLRRGEVPGLVPAPAEPRPGATVATVATGARRPGAALSLGSARGETADRQPFRVEYAVLSWRDEKVVARYLGHPDAIAFNLSLIRRSLQSLDGAALGRAAAARGPASAGAATDRAYPAVAFPSGDERIPVPPGWNAESADDAAWPTCLGEPPPPGSGLTVRHPRDFAVVLRAWRLASRAKATEEALARCGAVRHRWLGVTYDVRRTVVRRDGEALLLELEAPTAAAPAVEGELERWAAVVASPPAAPASR